MFFEEALELARQAKAAMESRWEERYGRLGLRSYASEDFQAALRTEFNLKREKVLELPAIGISRVNSTENRYTLVFRLRKYDQIRLIKRALPSLTEQEIKSNASVLVEAKAFSTQRIRPLCVGISVSSDRKKMAGTLGCFVKSRANSQDVCILSNNHVLADENRLPIGTTIIQPGLTDNGNPKSDRVAHLSAFEPLRIHDNEMDAAIARVDRNIGVKIDQQAAWAPSPPTSLDESFTGMEVVKQGRTTGFTEGVISSVDLNLIPIRFGRHYRSFNSVIEIEGRQGIPFAKPGDSGSLILSPDQQPLALLFAGGTVEDDVKGRREVAYAVPLRPILDRFEVDIIT